MTPKEQSRLQVLNSLAAEPDGPSLYLRRHHDFRRVQQQLLRPVLPRRNAFASVFSSARISRSWTTLVATLYTGLCLVVGPGLDSDGRDEKVPFSRTAALYAISMTVNLITHSQRIRRRAAVQRERELQQKRIELSKSIPDTVPT